MKLHRQTEEGNESLSVMSGSLRPQELYAACQAPPSMEFSRQFYWSGLPLSSPGDLPNPGIEPRYPTLQAHSLLPEPPGKPPQPDYLGLILDCMPF